MIITIPEKTYSLTELYDAAAMEMGYENTSELQYDCRKINIAANIQDGFYDYYTSSVKETDPYANETEIRTSVTMLLAISGPKVDKALKANEVEVFDGFIC